MRRALLPLVCLLAVAGCDNPVRKATRLAQEGKLAEAEALLEKACFERRYLGACLAAAASKLDLNDLDAAERYGNQARLIDPNDTTALLVLGNVAQARDDDETALRWFEAARDADPKNAMARNNLASVYLEAGRLDEAEEELRAATDLNEDLYLAWFNLGRLQAARGKNDEARQTWEYAAQLNPNAPDVHVALAALARVEGNRGAEISHLRSVVTLLPGEPQFALDLGTALLAEGRAAEAVQVLRRAVDADPQPITRRALARAYLAVGNPSFAVGQLRSAVEADPDDLGIAADLALAYLMADEQDAARIQAQAVLAEEPGAADCHFVLGALQSRARRPERARPHYLAAIKHDPGHLQSRMRLAEDALAGRRASEASEHLAAIEPARQHTPRIFFLQARVHAQQGRPAQALADIQQAMLARGVTADEVEAAPELRALRDNPEYRDAFDRLVGNKDT